MPMRDNTFPPRSLSSDQPPTSVGKLLLHDPTKNDGSCSDYCFTIAGVASFMLTYTSHAASDSCRSAIQSSAASIQQALSQDGPLTRAGSDATDTAIRIGTEVKDTMLATGAQAKDKLLKVMRRHSGLDEHDDDDEGRKK